MARNIPAVDGKVFCVIPAYNEAATIAAVSGEVKPLVDCLVVVDDGSSDRTGELAAAAGATVLTHLVNRGQGAALRTGTEYALNNGAGIIVHFDADGQFRSSDLKAVIEPLQTGQAEAAFGSRFLLPGGSDQMPFFKRRLIMPLARFVNKLFFNLNLTDPQSGFRAFSAAAARRISWRQDGMAHCSEIMFAVKKENLAVKEVPISVIYRDFGQSFSGGLKILKELFMALLAD